MAVFSNNKIFGCVFRLFLDCRDQRTSFTDTVLSVIGDERLDFLADDLPST